MQWDLRTIKGASRWLNRVWTLAHEHFSACETSSLNRGTDILKKKLVSAENDAIKQVPTYVL